MDGNSDARNDSIYPADILLAAANAERAGSLVAIAQAILSERERCAEIARTITREEAKVVIKPERLEYWEGLGCHVLAGAQYRINFKEAIARKIKRPSTMVPHSEQEGS
jgi:hypothetical protein